MICMCKESREIYMQGDCVSDITNRYITINPGYAIVV